MPVTFPLLTINSIKPLCICNIRMLQVQPCTAVCVLVGSEGDDLGFPGTVPYSARFYANKPTNCHSCSVHVLPQQCCRYSHVERVRFCCSPEREEKDRGVPQIANPLPNSNQPSHPPTLHTPLAAGTAM